MVKYERARRSEPALLDEYEVEAPRLEQDVRGLLQALQDQGLVKIEGS